MQYNTKTTVTLANGTYTWAAVTGWADQPMRAVVANGHIIAWDYMALDGSGDYIPTTPEDLEKRNADLMAALVHEITERQRLGSLIVQVAFTPAPEPAPTPKSTLGKARAHVLHQIMGRLGIREHYEFATRVLDVAWPVTSLAALSEREAEKVWSALTRQFPTARQIAQQLAA